MMGAVRAIGRENDREVFHATTPGSEAERNPLIKEPARECRPRHSCA